MFKSVIRTGNIVALAAAAMFGAAVPGIAAEPGATGRSMDVRYGDLDLSTEKGRAQLDTRVRRAAQQVCAVNTRDLKMMRLAQECRTVALNGAQPQIEVAVASQRSGQSQTAFNQIRIGAPSH